MDAKLLIELYLNGCSVEKQIVVDFQTLEDIRLVALGSYPRYGKVSQTLPHQGGWWWGFTGLSPINGRLEAFDFNARSLTAIAAREYVEA